ncbi:MAG: protoporphyrinogen oxidase [Ignavibacteriae bacterium]|nr:MAG: protoporphyrinogen oxidase [Ignavibacteriota bacterium]
MERTNKKVIIIGGGISGLTAAFWLKKNGVNITLLEKNSYVGGSIRTDHKEGYLIEYGPNSSLETTPLIEQLLGELGIASEKIYATEEAKKRYILRDGKLHPLPMGPGAFIKTKLFSKAAKLRLFKEPFIWSKSNEDETLADFTRRRLGDEFLDYAINPFVAGVFAGDPENLNVKTAFPKLYDLEQNYGGLIWGAFRSMRARKKSKEKSKQSAKTFSFKNGMQTLTDALYNAMKDDIILNAEVKEIKSTAPNGTAARSEISYLVNGEMKSENADAVVMATPAYIASGLMKTIDESLSQTLSNIYYPPVNVVFTGFSTSDIKFKLDGFGYLIPGKENKGILGSLWNSVLFPGRAPEGHSAITSFIGGSRSPELTELNDDQMLDMTLKDLDSILGIKDEPDFAIFARWKRAIPQYQKGYASVFKQIETFHEKNKSIRICSNYYKGISVSDCIKSADAAVTGLVSYLSTLKKENNHVNSHVE